ncbi:MAG: hypothetical protein Salg2KO_10290 [Salibacteraceae bacterium]
MEVFMAFKARIGVVYNRTQSKWLEPEVSMDSQGVVGDDRVEIYPWEDRYGKTASVQG